MGCGVRSFSRLRTDSSCRCEDFRDADQVVGSGGEREEPIDQRAAAMAGLAQAAHGLDPAEALLDALALDLADGVAGMARGAPIDRRAAGLGVLRPVRGGAQGAGAGGG